MRMFNRFLLWTVRAEKKILSGHSDKKVLKEFLMILMSSMVLKLALYLMKIIGIGKILQRCKAIYDAMSVYLPPEEAHRRFIATPTWKFIEQSYQIPDNPGRSGRFS